MALVGKMGRWKTQGGGGGGFVILAGSSGTGNSSVDATTPAIDTTGADLLVVVCASSSTGPPDISDSQGNTWTQATSVIEASNIGHRIFYVANPTTSSTHTFITTRDFPSICALAISGAAASPLDATATDIANSASLAAPSVDGCLIIAAAMTESAGTLAINIGYIIEQEAIYSGGGNYGCALAVLQQTTAASTTPTWSGRTITSCSIAAFKPA